MVTKPTKATAQAAAPTTATQAPAGTTATAPSTATPAKPATPVVRTMRAVPGTINVLKANATFRGARAAWYSVLVQHQGKPAQAYLDACLQKPPSLPASGRAEPPSGWLSWFVRNGICTIVPPQQQPTPPAK